MRFLKVFLILLLAPLFILSQNGTPDDYYEGFNFNLSPSDLKTALANLITSTSNLQSYDTAWEALKASDLASGSTTHVSLIYGYDDSDGNYETDATRLKDENQTSGTTGKWNREHVVSKSLASPAMNTNIGIGTDIHNLRAIDYNMNITRSNKRFQDNGSSGNSNTIINTGENGWFPGDGTGAGAGGDDYRGDVARIVMYMYLRYPDRVSANNCAELRSNTYHADMPDIFLEWNEDDPPSQLEINRNNTIESYQSNRNPFIDNPFLAYYIWGGPTISNWWSGVTIGGPGISFNSSNSVDENDSTVSANLSVTMSNYDSNDGNVVLTYSVNSSSTTAESGDYSYSPTSPNELTFNSNGTQTISITINSDADSDNETLVFDFSLNTSNVELRNTQHTITVVDDEKPLIITEIAEPYNSNNGRYIELYNPSASSINLDGLYLIRWTNDNADPTESSAKKLSDNCGATMEGKSFCILSKRPVSTMMAIYGFASDVEAGSQGVADSNGDDQIAIVLSDVSDFNPASYTILDIFGVPGEDGSGTSHDFENGRAERKASSTTPASSWNSSDWNVKCGSTGCGSTFDPQQCPDDYDPGYWIGATDVDTWTGLSGTTSWTTDENWASGAAPVSGDKVFIHDATYDPDVSTDVGSANPLSSLTVKANGVLDIEATGSISLSGNFTNKGTVTLNSDSNEFASLIVQGTSSGNIVYKRWIADEGTNEWDLIGSPVAGQSVSSFVSENTSLADHSTQYAIGVFSNDGSTDTAAAMYTNYTQSVIDVDDPDFVPGQGYAMATDEADTPGTTLDFTGTVRTTDLTGITIDDNTANAANFGKWNLVANPYPSYLNANDDADATASNNFLGVNASNLHSSFAYVYGYNGDGTYTYYNHVTPGSAVYIAPGQGFFVASDDPGGNTIKFTEAMQTVNGADDFNTENSDVMNNTHEVSLRLYHDNQMIDEAKLFFEENLGLGLDIGYDAGSFSQEAAIMTRLVEEDEGHGMAINAMGLDAMENAVIPLVINQSAGQEFRINLHTATIPDPNVYLEDVEEGTFTNLYEGDFVYTPTSDLSGVGRFFIHMTADTMSSGEVSTSMLNAYKEIDSSYITIEGLATQSNETKVSLYNILGREVLATTLNNNMGTQTISTVGLSAGIYVIELESGSDRLTKKLLIQ